MRLSQQLKNNEPEVNKQSNIINNEESTKTKTSKSPLRIADAESLNQENDDKHGSIADIHSDKGKHIEFNKSNEINKNMQLDGCNKVIIDYNDLFQTLGCKIITEENQEIHVRVNSSGHIIRIAKSIFSQFSESSNKSIAVADTSLTNYKVPQNSLFSTL